MIMKLRKLRKLRCARAGYDYFYMSKRQFAEHTGLSLDYMLDKFMMVVGWRSLNDR